MSLKFSYLKLSLRYVRGAKSTPVFSYPSSERAVRAPFDARYIMSRFVNLSDFYVMGCHDGSRYISYVSADDQADSQSDLLELTVVTDSAVLLPGRAVLNLFGSIKNMLENDEPFNDETIDAALDASGFAAEPLRGSQSPAGNDLKGVPCYRTFVSANELATILSFPRQSAYDRYSETVLTHVTAVPSPTDALPQITVPVSQSFTVVCPPDITASAETVELTDHLTLTYRKQGFEPATETFEVGTTNRFVRIQGPALLVNSAEKAGVTFIQRVPYTVVSSKGVPVTTYTILINGRTATRTDGYFEVSSLDFNNEGTVNITVSSTNYFTTSLDFTSEELAGANPLELVLVPEEMNVMLRLDFGDGRMMEQELTIEKSSSEYRLLRAGNFHGFRAHRLMSHEPETYSVDMAAPAVAQGAGVRTVADAYAQRQPMAATKPVIAPEVASEADEPAAPAHEAPKSAAQLRAERLQRDIPTKLEEAASEKAEKTDKRRKAYEKDIPRKADILEDDPDDDEDKVGTTRKIFSPLLLAIVAVVLVTGGIVWYILSLFPDAKPAEEQAVDVTAAADTTPRIEVIDDVTAQPVPAPESNVAAPSAEENADVEYLNTHDTWRLADLKSPRYREFFATLSTGDIDAIANTDYFAVRDRATNKKAVKIMDYLWEAKGTFGERRNVKAMTALKDKEEIDINALYELLARMQDSNPNKEERPQRDN